MSILVSFNLCTTIIALLLDISARGISVMALGVVFRWSYDTSIANSVPEVIPFDDVPKKPIKAQFLYLDKVVLRPLVLKFDNMNHEERSARLD
jgi:hypothetical protein